MTEQIDHQRLLAEIDEEVRRRRASGDIPVELERELDELFARHTPAMALEGTFEQVVDRAEGASVINARAPATSERPGVPAVKRTLQRSVQWMLDYMARQVTSYAEATTRALRVLGDRVDVLERTVAVTVLADFDRETPDRDHWVATLPRHLAGTAGRVVVAEAGDGALVRALRDSGIDAYGVEPDAATAHTAVQGGLEVRIDEPTAHFQRIDDGALAGAVLVAAPDYLPANAKLALARLATRKVAHGGTVVVVTSDVGTWEAADPVAADLAPGRPFRPETWVRIMRDNGLSSVIDRGPGSSAVIASR